MVEDGIKYKEMNDLLMNEMKLEQRRLAEIENQVIESEIEKNFENLCKNLYFSIKK